MSVRKKTRYAKANETRVKETLTLERLERKHQERPHTHTHKKSLTSSSFLGLALETLKGCFSNRLRPGLRRQPQENEEYQTVKRFVRKLRGNQPPQPRAVIITAPGEECQVDYGTGPMVRDPQTGKYRRTRLFVLTLGCSRKAVRLLSFRSSSHIGAERFCGTSPRLDSKLFNDQMRKYLSDRIWVEFYRLAIRPDQRYLGIALIPPRGPVLERFHADAPRINGASRFTAGDSAIRENDSSRILKRSDADAYARTIAVPTLGNANAVDEAFYRVLSPDYPSFVRREVPCEEVETGLNDRRTAITSLVGVGGTGKTALATWAALKAYDSKQFSFIVSITAKDRELTSTGIQALEPSLTSFEALLNNVLDVLNFPEYKAKDVKEKEASVRGLIADSGGLLFVDNLETVDDARIIQFLDSLPFGVRALTTSRRTSVRVSVHPVTVGALTPTEVVKFVQTLAHSPGFKYVADLAESERERIGVSCDGLPLSRSGGHCLDAVLRPRLSPLQTRSQARIGTVKSYWSFASGVSSTP